MARTGIFQQHADGTTSLLDRQRHHLIWKHESVAALGRRTQHGQTSGRPIGEDFEPRGQVIPELVCE